MSDGASKLTGWISVWCDVPPWQHLSSQPVHSCYRRKDSHRGANAAGSEKEGGKMAISRGPILYDTINICKGRILIRILLQEDGGSKRSLRRKDRDLAFVS